MSEAEILLSSIPAGENERVRPPHFIMETPLVRPGGYRVANDESWNISSTTDAEESTIMCSHPAHTCLSC